jgi:hypothetical protein
MDCLKQLFTAGGFPPHGYCCQWNWGLVWLHVLSDALIAVAYFTIPFTLLWFIPKRRDLRFSWMFALFGVFTCQDGSGYRRCCGNRFHQAGQPILRVPVWGGADVEVLQLPLSGSLRMALRYVGRLVRGKAAGFR